MSLFARHKERVSEPERLDNSQPGFASWVSLFLASRNSSFIPLPPVLPASELARLMRDSLTQTHGKQTAR